MKGRTGGWIISNASMRWVVGDYGLCHSATPPTPTPTQLTIALLCARCAVPRSCSRTHNVAEALGEGARRGPRLHVEPQVGQAGHVLAHILRCDCTCDGGVPHGKENEPVRSWVGLPVLAYGATDNRVSVRQAPCTAPPLFPPGCDWVTEAVRAGLVSYQIRIHAQLVG